ncbi:GTP cyclohydrolase IIa [Staphylothermus hellenicus]|uniref:GTP cyclohydrolase IIa n=1 Tax=Staphylothermus hellenicus TaxID=84599 RepID=UPI000699A081|nr:GTP cyclohydrolase IIa [Staphylothermus hellenicus]
MPRITVIRLLKYRKWTEELGYDREWIIQKKQARTYDILQTLFSKKNGFVVPLRYDHYLALSNGIDKETHQEILTEIDPVTPYGVKIVSIAHKYPAIGQLIASRLLEEKPGKIIYLDGVEDENVVVHIDFNSVTMYTEMTSIFESYMRILELYDIVTKYVFQLGGITSYLGGDNMLAVVPENKLDELLELIPSYLKAGVGLSYVPRKALLLASKALTIIRSGKVDKRFLILRDEDV